MDCAIEDPQQSVRCGFGQETFAGAAGNGQDAPKPVIRAKKKGLACGGLCNDLELFAKIS